MDIVNRLKQYMAHVGLPSTQFADVANIPRPTISQILNGRNRKVSNELIAKLHDAFPTLNILWLLFGDGEMETKQNIEISERQNKQSAVLPHLQMPNNDPISEAEKEISLSTNKLRSSDIDEFVNDTLHKDGEQTKAGGAVPAASDHRIRYIMVFYNDNSFEVLTPEK